MTAAPPDALDAADLEQIQALVFRGWKFYPYVAYHFVRFTDQDTERQAQGWLRQVGAEIAWAGGVSPTAIDGAGVARDARVQLALTTRGMRRLGLPWDVVRRFPYEAKAGMERRAPVLGDKFDAAGDDLDDETLVDDQTWLEEQKPWPPEWAESGGLDLRLVDALVLIYARSRSDLLALTAASRDRVETYGGGVTEQLSTEWKDHEPFGFADGVSQPVIRGQPRKSIGDPMEPDVITPGTTPPFAPERVGSKNEIAAGEIVLGFRNEYGQAPQSPTFPDRWPTDPSLAGRDIGRHGTYLVFRKLEQDVAGFWDTFLDLGRRFAGKPLGDGKTVPVDPKLAARWLAARAMGRWPNGNSVHLCPDAEQPEMPQPARNAFIYGDDPDGLRCPVGAHVRRANPRDQRDADSASSSWKVVRRHRIIRRGRAYGDRLLTADQLLDGERDTSGMASGLLFVCLQASITHGFEFVQQIWNNNPCFHGVHQEPDVVVGPGGSRFTIPAEPVRLRLQRSEPDPERDARQAIEKSKSYDPLGLPRFVIPRGGGYFFMPSRATIELLCGPPQP